ncbi:hypothetical protein L596_026452 [Steinernema carpocapsae]|uniref:Uncharacterized protein n=1 Tax=Steinernema carpocapsae TaxID=34508 RepID=A0A4U5M1E8_STECR|nr:hypothetical protein L596_026452 [Steinernema carpocapsae]
MITAFQDVKKNLSKGFKHLKKNGYIHAAVVTLLFYTTCPLMLQMMSAYQRSPGHLTIRCPSELTSLPGNGKIRERRIKRGVASRKKRVTAVSDSFSSLVQTYRQQQQQQQRRRQHEFEQSCSNSADDCDGDGNSDGNSNQVKSEFEHFPATQGTTPTTPTGDRA